MHFCQSISSPILIAVVISICFSCNENKYSADEVKGHGLQILNEDFAKDSTIAYYHHRPIEGSDAATFLALDEHYAKDKANVYYCNDESYLNHWPLTWEPAKERRSINILEGARASDFVSLGYGYAKDSLSAFFEGEKFKVADVLSLKALSTSIIIDNREAYFNRHRVIGSDGKSFVLIGGDELSSCCYYAQDSKFVYYYTDTEIKIIPCSKSAFKIIEREYSRDDQYVFYGHKKLKDVDLTSFKLLDENYSRDARNIYFKSTKLEGINPSEFKIVQYHNDDNNYFNSSYSRDNNLVFWEGSKLNGADAKSFTVLYNAEDYAKDKTHAYYHDKLIPGADVRSFKALGYGGHAKDTISEFDQGVRRN